MSENTAVIMTGGTQLIIQGYGPAAVRDKLNVGMKMNEMVEFPLSPVPIDGVNPYMVCFIAAATLTQQKKLVGPNG